MLGENIMCFTLIITAIVFFLLYIRADFEKEKLEKFINKTLTNSTN
jgi:hypothetical protein